MRGAARDAVMCSDTNQLAREVSEFIQNGHATATRDKYSSVTNFYRQVVGLVVQPFPASGSSVAIFIWSLSRAGYKYSSVISYVSAVKTTNTSYGHTLSSFDQYQISQALKSAAKICDLSLDQKEPLSRDQVISLGSLDTEGHNIYITAALVGIYGFLRPEEIIDMDSGDLSFPNAHGRLVAQLVVKYSKTDQCGKSEKVYIGCVLGRPLGTECVGYCAFHRIRDLPKSDDSLPLFTKRGNRITYDKFSSEFRCALQRIGVPSSTIEDFGLHSLRRTGVQLGYGQNADEHLLREQGRWSSNAIHQYLRGASASKRVRLAEVMMGQSSEA